MFASAGDIRNLTIPWLFLDIRKAKKTGTATFEQDSTTKKVYFKQGDVLFASSNRDEDRLGEFLLSMGKITRAQFDTSSDIVIKTGKKLGAVLVEAGILTPRDLVDQVKLQVKRIILSLFGWRTGRYRYDDGHLPVTDIIPLHVSTGDLIIEGIYSLGDKVVRPSLPPSRTVLRPASDTSIHFQYANLEQDLQVVIWLIDGARSIQDIYRLSGLDDARALKAIYAVLALRMAHAEEIKSAAGKERTDATGPEESVERQAIQGAYDGLELQNYYEVLGVGHGATSEEIGKNYYVLAKLYHPDRHQEPSLHDMKEKLEALYSRVQEAYETLNSAAARSRYNLDLASGTATHGTTSRAQAEKPDNGAAAAVQYHEGLKQFNAKNFWGADEAFQTALRLDPDNSEYLYRRGLALSRMPRRGHEAEEYFVKATELAPEQMEYLLELGNFYLRTDQKARALSVYQDALKRDPGSDKIKQAIKKAGG